MALPKSHIGKTFYIAAGVPATNDAAGFNALTWVKVNGYMPGGPQFGITHGNIGVRDQQTGFVVGLKGTGEGQESQINFYKVAADAGQIDLQELAADGRGLCSVKVGLGSGTNQALETGDPIAFAQGYLKSFVETPVSDDNEDGFSVTFHQNAVAVYTTEPA